MWCWNLVYVVMLADALIAKPLLFLESACCCNGAGSCLLCFLNTCVGAVGGSHLVGVPTMDVLQLPIASCCWKSREAFRVFTALFAVGEWQFWKVEDELAQIAVFLMMVFFFATGCSLFDAATCLFGSDSHRGSLMDGD
ncbi:hypothetical protein Nepgr_033614 [Nepenthes gracilis]|uniref:Uncharacterized protein n=1 Tax=Nepenthes gracilis TaxID=150966 RepID=A0AAD3Y8I5_NEPGR|nr:hypothetical protein Nepgr_033614 [Nepenthes gracilis]